MLVVELEGATEANAPPLRKVHYLNPKMIALNPSDTCRGQLLCHVATWRHILPEHRERFISYLKSILV